MKQIYTLLAGFALVALPSWAQQKKQIQAKDTTVNRTVVVEQEYTPIIGDASKVNVLPKVTNPTVSKKEVEYATTWSPANNIPSGTMQPYTGKEVQASTLPGYARLGYGNYGNLDILGNYLFRLTDKDKLNVNFKMDGMNGTLDMPAGNAREWNARYYRTRANVDYTHQFNKLDLNVAGNFGLSNFNYEPYGFDFKKQKFTSGDVHFGMKSTDETLPLQFRAETNLMMYNRQHNLFYGSLTETLIRTQGVVTGAISDEQLVGIGLNMDNLIYNKEKVDDYENVLYDSRTALGLNPYYELNSDSWKLHIGANVDFSFGGGKALQVSPDVTVQYLFSDSYLLYAKATGGKRVNDFRRLERYNPYLDPSAPITGTVEDTYEQLNAALGFKACPTPGLWFDLFGGYQNLKNDLYEIPNVMVGGLGGSFIDLKQTNTDNLYLGAKVSYAYKDLFSLSAEGTYYHWNAKDASNDSDPYNIALLMKPQFDFGFNAEVHPLPALWLNLGYRYIYRAEQSSGYQPNIPAVSNLSLGATYRVYKGVSIYAKVDNLLNKKFQWYYTIPTEGTNFLGGLSFAF